VESFLRKIWLLAITTPLLTKITDSGKGKMLIAIRHLKQVVPHLNLIYYTQGDLDDLVRDFSLSNNKLYSQALN